MAQGPAWASETRSSEKANARRKRDDIQVLGSSTSTSTSTSTRRRERGLGGGAGLGVALLGRGLEGRNRRPPTGLADLGPGRVLAAVHAAGGGRQREAEEDGSDGGE